MHASHGCSVTQRQREDKKGPWMDPRHPYYIHAGPFSFLSPRDPGSVSWGGWEEGQSLAED